MCNPTLTSFHALIEKHKLNLVANLLHLETLGIKLQRVKYLQTKIKLDSSFLEKKKYEK